MTPEVRHSQHSPELRAAARHIGRRRFLTTTGAAAALAFAVGVPGAGTAAAAELDAARITDDPFTLGVASGDPHPDSVLLWTRLAPAPCRADSGLPAQRVAGRLLRDGGGGAGAQAGVTPGAPVASPG